MKNAKRARRNWVWLAVATACKAAFVGLAVLMPLLGVWIGSSLAIYFDGPLWLALLLGGLSFPVLPLLWEGVAALRARLRRPGRVKMLTLLDRMVLRTLAVNLVFVGGLIAGYPATVFSALSERGDWMLEGRSAPWAQQTRSILHRAADHMEWLHDLTHPNAYEEFIDPEATGEHVDLSDSSQWGDRFRRPDTGSGPVLPQDVFQHDAWPFVPELHPLVTAIPEDQEDSPEAIGRYIAERESDTAQRLKAVHDYVADRIAYDVPALEAMQFPPQDAQTVLDSGKGVCAGYAALVKAIGDAAGLEVVVVVGKTRATDSLGHAWNAANVDGKWYLLDATWDAGSVDDEGFNKRYTGQYLMAPPDAFLTDHFPDDAKWQMRDTPISMGEFLRRPDLDPSFYGWGLDLVSPQRSQVSTSDDTFTVEVENPHGFHVAVNVYLGDTWDGPGWPCETNASSRKFECPLDGDGQHLVVLFGPDNHSMGKVHVTAE